MSSLCCNKMNSFLGFFPQQCFFCQIMCVLSCERVIPKFQSSENNLGSTKQFSINLRVSKFQKYSLIFSFEAPPGWSQKNYVCLCVVLRLLSSKTPIQNNQHIPFYPEQTDTGDFTFLPGLAPKSMTSWVGLYVYIKLSL